MDVENFDEYKYSKKRPIIEVIQKGQMQQKPQYQNNEINVIQEKCFNQVNNCFNEQVQKEIIDYRHYQLRENYSLRPLLITEDRVIFLDVFHKLYRQAYEFIISIADPIERPSMIQKYKITKFSLYTAMVLQYKPDDIIRVLSMLSKNLELPIAVIDFIKQNTINYGTAKFFLENNVYYLDIDSKVYESLIESNRLDIINKLQEIQIINKESCLVQENQELLSIGRDVQNYIVDNTQQQVISNQQKQQQDMDVNEIEDEETLQTFQQKRSFKRFIIKEDHVKVCQEIIKFDIPLIQEYDFIRDLQISIDNNQIQQQQQHDQQSIQQQQQQSIQQQPLDINLKGNIKLRFYQERALKNIFIDDKARSGLIILPCGAGKTIIGIYVISRIKGNTVIICDSEVSVEQWRSELLRCTTINSHNIIRLTGKIRDPWLTKPIGCSNLNNNFDQNRAVIVITTYYMFTKKRKNENEIVQQIKNSAFQWNLCVIDEVHKLPAPTFQKVLTDFKFRCKIGLTATPYREDQKIDDLFYMIGPKLYEENWLDLVNQGYLAKPYCVEIRCQMTQLFKQYYQTKHGAEQQLLYTANPTKFKALQYLIKIHEQMGDKILVFCDRPKVIEYFGNQLKYPVIHGHVNSDERRKILFWFQTNSKVNTVFISRVGDTAIDLPSASVGIQIGFHFQSRRQEVQRLGRIMRPKENQNGEYSAFWYTLVSQETKEAIHCLHRQQCLINQGFNYEIVKEEDMPYNKNPQKFPYIKQLDEKDYLYDIQAAENDQVSEESQSTSSYSSDDSDEIERPLQYQKKEVQQDQQHIIFKVNIEEKLKKKKLEQ